MGDELIGVDWRLGDDGNLHTHTPNFHERKTGVDLVNNHLRSSTNMNLDEEYQYINSKTSTMRAMKFEGPEPRFLLKTSQNKSETENNNVTSRIIQPGEACIKTFL